MGIPLTFLYARLLESSSSCSSFLQPPNLFVLALLALVVLPVLTYRGPYRRLEVCHTSHTELTDRHKRPSSTLIRLLCWASRLRRRVRLRAPAGRVWRATGRRQSRSRC